MASFEITAGGAFDDRLAQVERAALDLGFEPIDPEPLNALYNPKGDVRFVQAYQLPERPKLQLTVKYYPFGTGPYGGESRWFRIVLIDGRQEGVEFKGIARQKLKLLVERLRSEFGREHVKITTIVSYPEIE